mmetsp:Transcript_33394/g.67383  ORF Transcript_33394/g.67383 Transcript_33394/m.67383 type:complete len:249 (+) Transcript_33394:170-916(+)|eukprot:CAMPEP_0178547076 /NCGR_PEP_ID=MMETSP0697-20121206/4488_1 /TAXON_ID=265572 /ORGANISM="Extubocellulus spinifer, Strain CCMP396" /LENGTH=248 /DNA_ID=CAMNT_0020179697 /DNA_START=98 /DNA_END=844 /DNA_ORIENTATION=+
MKLSFTVLVGATSLGFASGNESRDLLRRRLIEVDPDYAPTQICKDGKPPPHTLEIRLFTDQYPEETKLWVSEENSPLDAVLKHTNFSLKNTMHSLTTKICDGTYNVNVKDEYGDGICCGYGEGYYEVFLDDNMIHNGGGGLNGGGEEGEFEYLDTFQFMAEELAMPPQDFYGWDGRACVSKTGDPGVKNQHYKVFNLNFEECMHKACTNKKWKGLEYVDDECRIWKVTPSFETQEGSLCFMRKFTSLK